MPDSVPSCGHQRQRQNVLAFMRWDGGDFYPTVFEGSIDNHLVAGCFRAFAKAKKGEKPKSIARKESEKRPFFRPKLEPEPVIPSLPKIKSLPSKFGEEK
jgi:hypothetical protein